MYQPLYLNNVMHVEIDANGLYTAIPWLAYIVASLVCGNLSDWIITGGHLTITRTRKFIMVTCEFSINTPFLD